VLDFVEMAAALWRFWSVRGLFSEGRYWLDAAIRLARNNDVEGPLLAAALDGAGILAESQGDAVQAQALHLEALALWREASDAIGIARSLENLGILALHVRGDVATSRELHTEALRYFETTKDRRGIASSLKSLADVALISEEFAEASALYARSLSIARQLHDTRGIAAGLTSLGALTFLEGDPERSIGLYEEAISYWRLLDDVPGIALCVGNLGEALTFAGRSDEAIPLLKECLDLSREIGDQQGIAFALTHLGRLARSNDVRIAAQHYAEAAELSRSIGDNARLAESVEGLAGALLDAGHADMAARLFGLAQTIREQTGVALPSVHHSALASDHDTAKLMLGSTKFAALVAEGSASDLDALLPKGPITRIKDVST
jgi:tetratricopeptide (TPR) repeat protein